MIIVDEHCTGCLSCVAACPKTAISASVDQYGFSVPQVDMEKCIDCGACNRACTKEAKASRAPLFGYWLKSKDVDVLKGSSSGGAFHYLAKKIIADSGVVFGCVFDAEQKRFICASSDDYSLEELQKSKYVESFIGDAFLKVELFLKARRKVLFCGTPCQCAGLNAYLKKEYENLVVVDFACGGVPSQKFFVDYMRSLEKKFNSRVVSVDFRDKYYRWGQHCISFTFENGKVYRRMAEADPYFYSFLHAEIKRKSCRDCPFSAHHCSDIVLADYWKYKTFSKELNEDTQGLSLVVTLSEKGDQLFRDAADTADIEFGRIDIKDAAYNFAARKATSTSNEKIEELHSFIASNGIKKYYQKTVPLKSRIKFLIKQRTMSKNDWK